MTSAVLTSGSGSLHIHYEYTKFIGFSMCLVGLLNKMSLQLFAANHLVTEGLPPLPFDGAPGHPVTRGSLKQEVKMSSKTQHKPCRVLKLYHTAVSWCWSPW